MNRYKLNIQNALQQNASGGQLLKWHINNMFIKTSSFATMAPQPGFLYESYAEVIAGRICSWLGFPHVSYRLCRVALGRNTSAIACESTDFTLNKGEYISIGDLMLSGSIPTFMPGNPDIFPKLCDCMEQYCRGFRKHIERIILLDFLILNEDRHFGNFGVILDNTNKMSIAPIFDSGSSLFYHKLTKGMTFKPYMIQYLYAKPFHMNFDRQIRLISAETRNIPNIIPKLEKLLTSLVKNYGLPSDRAEFAYSIVKYQYTKLIHID